MRCALFKCFGTGKLIYFEELPSNKIRFLIGYNAAINNDTQAINWLQDHGFERIIRGKFEYHYDNFHQTPMRCLFLRDTPLMGGK